MRLYALYMYICIYALLYNYRKYIFFLTYFRCIDCIDQGRILVWLRTIQQHQQQHLSIQQQHTTAQIMTFPDVRNHLVRADMCYSFVCTKICC